MATKKVVFVKCQFSKGAFPSELVFHIEGTDGGQFVGVAPLSYCRFANKDAALAEIKAGVKAGGSLPGIVVEWSEGKLPRVLLPDNNIYDIPEEQFVTEDAARVPVKS